MVVIARCFALLLVATAVTAKPQTIKQFFDGESLAWTTNIPHEGGSLYIVGPDGFRDGRTFAPGEILAVDLAELGTLPDGRFRFELALKARRDGGDNRAAATGIPRQVGSFTVVDNRAVNPNLTEAQPKQTITTDTSIQASLCVGLDCANNEFFGEDTIRLKENNLRIRAVDTSVSQQFPSQDWVLEFNDSDNGGDNYFAVETANDGRQVFRVNAGAPSNALLVDEDGDVGIGAFVPMTDLHILTGDTAAIRLEQDVTLGFEAQSWQMTANELAFVLEDRTATTAPFKVYPGSDENLLQLGDTTGITPANSNRVTVTGQLFIGTSQVTPDYVFSQDFDVPSIEEHATAMWTNRHLPFVQPAAADEAENGAMIEVGARSQSVLKELEIAHIYIEQLHKRLEELESRLEAIER
ncbi:MAG: hypothetical protein AAGE01_08335 [Pseudomonadota bacterium]